MRQARINPTERRHGIVVVVVLVCLTVVTLLLGSLLHNAMAWRRQVRTEVRHAQAEWLADSGVARALMKTESNAEYAGEVWKPKETLVAGTRAIVEITVSDGGTRINVNATISGTTQSTARRSFVVDKEREE